MRILLTNDDGYDAPGLLALRAALERIGEIHVVAPDRNWSVAGHVKTLHKPLRLTRVRLADGTPAHACSGAPSDCVALALLGALDFRPEMIVAGINPHPNLGHDLTYSGTVTAAMEGTIFGVPSIALSAETAQAYRAAAAFAAWLVPIVAERGLPPEVLLNINVPAGPVRGVEITRLGRRIYNDELIVRSDPRGVPYYWIGGREPTGQPDGGTDIGALHSGHISVTPIQLDMTAESCLPALRAWVSPPVPD